MVQPVWRTGPIYAPDALKRFLIMGCVYFSRGRRTPTITIRSFLRDANAYLEPIESLFVRALLSLEPPLY